MPADIAFSSAAALAAKLRSGKLSARPVGPYLGDLSTIGFARLLEREYAGYTAPAAFSA